MFPFYFLLIEAVKLSGSTLILPSAGTKSNLTDPHFTKNVMESSNGDRLGDLAGAKCWLLRPRL